VRRMREVSGGRDRYGSRRGGIRDAILLCESVSYFEQLGGGWEL
jgi:hypothetical protein